MYGLWHDPIYVQTAAMVMAALIVLASICFAFRKRGPVMLSGWASLKSWLYFAPFILAALALPRPWPLVFVTFVAVVSAKTFFQMIGMYHRSWFVWMTYIFIFGLGYIIYDN